MFDLDFKHETLSEQSISAIFTPLFLTFYKFVLKPEKRRGSSIFYFNMKPEAKRFLQKVFWDNEYDSDVTIFWKVIH